MTYSPIVSCHFCGWIGPARLLEAHMRAAHPQLYVSDGGVTAVPDMVECPYCHVKFLKTEIDEHILTHHTYVCGVCGAPFHSVEELNVHKKNVHPTVLPPPTPKPDVLPTHKPFICELCGLEFDTLAEYNEHKRLYHGKLVPEPYVPPAPSPSPAWTGYCFIATAAFGTPLSPELVRLRFVRDNYLPRRLVNLYYWLSPPIALYISRRELAKRLVRAWIRVFLRLCG